jgi:hypothetical protein
MQQRGQDIGAAPKAFGGVERCATVLEARYDTKPQVSMGM